MIWGGADYLLLIAYSFSRHSSMVYFIVYNWEFLPGLSK
jgi:hypothetical protein